MKFTHSRALFYAGKSGQTNGFHLNFPNWGVCGKHLDSYGEWPDGRLKPLRSLYQTLNLTAHLIPNLGVNSPAQSHIHYTYDPPAKRLSVTNGYDQFLRRTNLTVLAASGILSSNA